MIHVTDASLRRAAGEGMDAFIKVFTDAYMEATGGRLTAETMPLLTGEQHTLLAYAIFRDEVMEGGFCQLVQNGYGSYIFGNPFAKAMRLWGVSWLAKLVYAAKKIYESYYQKCYNSKTKAFTGCTEMLMKLTESGCQLAVLSNKQQSFVTEIVSTLFPEIPFVCVIGQGEFPTKPDPAAVEFIVGKTGVSKYECFLVGDSDVDMQTAINAGIHPVGVSWGYRDAGILREKGAEFIAGEPADINNKILLTQI